jgi:hypothetical protein
VKESQYHSKSEWEHFGGVSLEMLLTCRQIHNEAVLVPFSANEFGIHSGWSTSDNRTKILFLRDLIPDQRRAITTLHIRGNVRYGFVKQHITSMPGLRRLRLSFDWNMMSIRNSPDLLMAALEDRFENSGVSMFAMAKLRTVDFTIDLTVFSGDVQAVLAQEKELIDWVESKRVLLLTKRTPVARTRRAGAFAAQPTRVSECIRAQRGKGKTSTE